MVNKIFIEEFFDGWFVKYDDLFKDFKYYVCYFNEVVKIFY